MFLSDFINETLITTWTVSLRHISIENKQTASKIHHVFPLPYPTPLLVLVTTQIDGNISTAGKAWKGVTCWGFLNMY